MKPLSVLLLLLCTVKLLAEPGKVIIKGTKETPYIYNSNRGNGRLCFEPDTAQKGCVILLPEDQCKDLLYMIADGKTSWIRVLPGETVVVNVGKEPWKFSKDEAAINAYLYDWTRKMYFGKPNALVPIIQMMMVKGLPKGNNQMPDAEQFYTPEYMAWVRELKSNSFADLYRAKIKDKKFTKEQQERIEYVWWEFQLLNYMRVEQKRDVPAEALDFVKEISFDKESLLDYPGFENVMHLFFNAADNISLIKYTGKDFLYRRAERIKDLKIREVYVLDELKTVFALGYLYQADQLLASVANVFVTENGKQQYAEYLEEYQSMLAAPENKIGKLSPYFGFDDQYGNLIKSFDFKGKYLLIDIWASWCAPCKYQIPFLLELEKALHGRDIEFVSISADKPEDKEKWLSALEQFGMEQNCVISSDAFENQFFKFYDIGGIPRFVLLSPDGKVVMDKARRPSDPILKLQLIELLDQYDAAKSQITGGYSGDAQGQVYMSNNEMMSATLAVSKVKNGRFDLTAAVDKPVFLSVSMPRVFFETVYVEPGDRMEMNVGQALVFTGDHADINNLMVMISAKYMSRFPEFSKTAVFNKKRSGQIVGVYNDIVKEIEKSVLNTEDKRMVTGYFQGEMLAQMYRMIYISKIMGKAHPKPVVTKDYSRPVLGVKLLPEIVYYPGWKDYVQEFLYAQLMAGSVKIRSNATRLADMANGLSDPTLRESYVMQSLEYELLRREIVGIEERIATVKPMIRKTSNLDILEEMVPRIRAEEANYKRAAPGTDLSGFSFVNENGKSVSIGDFKGKYVFIDLWSTGCNPCVGEIPYIKEMEHRFTGKPIVWVSISLDLHEKDWKKFLIDRKMKGIQLLCEKGFNHPFIQQIGTGGIPQFLILDKTGKMIDFNTMRPSNPVLGEVLNMLLKDQK